MLATQPTVITRPLPEITPDEALAAGRLLAIAFPRRDQRARAEQLLSLGRDYDGPPALAPRMHVVDRDGLVVAHALTKPRTIQAADGPMTVLALAMVATDPDVRGGGLGKTVVRAAFDLVDKGLHPFCLFQTSFAVEPFYDRLGACRVANRVVNSLADADPAPNPFWDEVVMRYPAGEGWPEGTIDLLGPGY
ncbi:MAG: GNAT family N-acetyltransferase [Lacipirellulaceae bacterium]